MTTPRRLLDDGADGFERRLLRAADGDRPSRSARSRLLVTLGVAAAATTATETAGAAGATGGLTTLAKAWGIKTLGVAALLTVTGATAVHVARSTRASGSEAAPQAVTVAASPRPKAPVATMRREEPSPAPEAAYAPVPALPVPRARNPAASVQPRAIVVAAPAPTEPPAPALRLSPPPALGEETASLDAARSALRSGRAGEALVQLDAYARRFPGGVLGPESSALRVEALLLLGDRAGAEAIAHALIASAPRTSAARRASVLLNP